MNSETSSFLIENPHCDCIFFEDAIRDNDHVHRRWTRKLRKLDNNYKLNETDYRYKRSILLRKLYNCDKNYKYLIACNNKIYKFINNLYRDLVSYNNIKKLTIKRFPSYVDYIMPVLRTIKDYYIEYRKYMLIFNNLERQVMLELDQVVPEISSCNIHRFKGFIKRKNKSKFSSTLLIGPRNLCTPPAERDVLLLSVLKEKLWIFRYIRLHHGISLEKIKYHSNRQLFRRFKDRCIDEELDIIDSIRQKFEEIDVQAQSDSVKDDKGEPVVALDQAQNVIIEETNPSSSENNQDFVLDKFWLNSASSDVKDDYNALTSRWIELNNFSWHKDDFANKFLVDLDLPKDLLRMDNGSACSRPNTIPFKVNALASYDLEVKVVLNAQKFQIGQLMCCWYYAPHFDSAFENRFQLPTLSQTQHFLITANISNEGSMYIPYNYYAPYIRTRDRKDMPEANNMGKFIITVLNPLAVSAAGPSSCDGTVFVRFSNATFTGTVSGELGTNAEIKCKAQSVFSNVMGAVVKELMTDHSNENRDNPPDPIPGKYLIPTASHSWSVGTGMTEPIQPLRLDGRGQRAYLNSESKDMKVNDIVSTYGYVRTINVDTSTTARKMLYSFEASPMMRKDRYQHNEPGLHKLTEYCLPPVAVVSNLYNYWRGSIDFRFDFVYSNVGHNARFMIAYIPGVTSSDTVTYEMAKSSPHIITSLGENNSITYNIPYIAHRPYWSRNYTGNFDSQFVNPPSMLYIFLLNKFVPMEASPQQMYINVWMKAGSDFEVAVPIQPNIGLSFNSTVIYNNTELIQAKDGYYPYYWGNYYRAGESQILILRHVATSGASTVFPSTFASKMQLGRRGYYYTPYDVEDMPQYKDGNVMRMVEFGVVCQTTSEGDWIMVACPTEIAAQHLCLMADKGVITTSSLNKYCIVNRDTTSNTWSKGNPRWVVHEFNKPANFQAPDKALLSTNDNLVSLQHGRLLFGERFDSLKDLTRRYQVYAKFMIDISNLQLGQCSVVMPLMYQGLDLDVGDPKAINEISNRCRDGHIPIIASGYRYGSGSLRFRLVVPTTKNLGIWVQHRPDRKLRSRKIIPCREILTAESLANHSYGSYLQLSAVNGVVEFEVPYYVPGPVVMLQKPYITDTDDALFYSLGEIAIGFILNKAAFKDLQTLPISVYYALGDDSQFTTFQGFPPMVLLDDISDVPVSAQSDKPQAEKSKKGFFSKMFNSATEGIKEDIKDEVKSTISEHVQPVIDDATAKVNGIVESLKNTSGLDVLKYPLVRTIIDKMVHIGLSPTFKTIAWSIISILVEVGLLCTNVSIAILEKLVEFLNRMSEKAQSSPTKLNEGVEVAEEAGDVPVNVQSGELSETDDITLGLLTLLWGAVCGIIGYKARQPHDLGTYAKFLIVDLGNVFKCSNSFCIFFKNILTTLKKMYHWAIRKMYPDYETWETLSENYESVKAWCNEVNYLCDTALFDKIIVERDLIDRVMLAYDLGLLYTTPFMKLHEKDSKNAEFARALASLRENMRRISKLKDDCLAMGIDPHVRKMPFTVAMYGEPGIGKTHNTDKVCAHLLSAQNYTFKGPMICTVNPTDKYWSQCSRQPVLLMDDLWAVESGDMLYQQIAMLNMVVSSVPLTPPMAELHDKKMRYNPEIFWYNTNKPFVVFDRVEPHMIWRRRDVLVHVKHIDFNDPFQIKQGCEHCEMKVRPQDLTTAQYNLLKDNHHLLYGFHPDVLNPNRMPQEYFTYEDFLVQMEGKYLENRERETQRFEESVQLMNTFKDNCFLDDETSLSDRLVEIRELIRLKNIKIREDTVMKFLEEHFKKFGNKTVYEFFVKTYANFKYTFDLSDSWEDFLKLFKKCSEDDKASVPSKSQSADSEEETTCSDDVEIESCTDSEWNAYQKTGDWETCDVEEMVNEIREKLDITARYSFKVRPSYSEMVKHMQNLLRGKIDLKWKQKMNIEHAPPIMQVVCEMVDNKMITENMAIEVFCSFAYVDAWVNEKSFDSFVCVLKMVQDTWHMLTLPRSTSWADFWSRVFLLLHYTKVDHLVILKTDIFSCMHFHNIKQFSWNTTSGWMKDGLPIDLHSCTENICCFNNPILYRGFLEAFLINNPIFKVYYRNGKRNLLPPEYSEIITWFPSREGWKGFIIDIIERVFLTMTTVVIKILRFYSDYYPIINGVLLTLVMLTAGIMGVKNAGATTNIPAAGQSPAYGHAWGSAPSTAPPTTHIFQSDMSHMDVVLKRLDDNFVNITATFDGKYVTYRCLAIKDRSVMVLRHYVEEMLAMPPHAEFYYKVKCMEKSPVRYGVKFNMRDMSVKWYDNEKDNLNRYKSNLGIIDMPLTFPLRKSIVPYLATSKMHTHASSYGKLYDGKVLETNVFIKRSTGKNHVVSSDGIISAVAMNDVYTYQKNHSGMCGTIVLSPNMDTPIIGIHVAGYTGVGTYGISEILCKEMFSGIAQVEQPYKDLVIPVLKDEQFGSLDLQTAIFPYGCVDGKFKKTQGGKTQLVPSVIHGSVPVNTEPNPLSASDRRLPKGSNPLYDGVAHKGKPPIDFEDELLDIAADDLEFTILREAKMVRSKISVLSLQDAVCGIAGVDYFDGIELSTSAGFPLSAIKTTAEKGKRWLFDLEEQVGTVPNLKGMHEELKRLYSIDMSMRARGIKPFTVFEDCLKDTCLPKEKCKIPGKTRIFSISPVQFTIAFKQYCSDFLASYQTHRMTLEHGIGINCQSREWNYLATKLLNNSEKIVTGDYKNFGPGLMKKCVAKVIKIIISWYKSNGATQEHCNILRIMLHEIMDAYYLCYDTIYGTPCGIPSGSPITAPLNSMVNSLYLRSAWLRLTKLSMKEFHSNVVLFTYGDDVIMSVKEDVIGKFNSVTLGTFFQKYDIIFTDQDKEGVEIESRTLDTATFLKRHFVHHSFREGLYVGMLDDDSIYNAINWVSCKNDIVANTIQNCDAALLLSVERGKKFYDDLARKLIIALNRQNISFSVQPWKVLDENFYNQV